VSWHPLPAGVRRFVARYSENSMTRDGAEMDRVAAAVAGHGIHIALGFSERNGGSLYLAQNCPGWVIGRVA
jgi:aliphatic nitrilase